MRNAIPIFMTLLMVAAVPLTIMTSTSLDDVPNRYESDDSTSVHDVPTWRIGDKWVYETTFDVAQLITQANVSASISDLTGDTTMEVVDIRFEDIQGSQTLVYELDISGDFTSGNWGATLEGVSGRLDIEYRGTDIIQVRDLATWESEFTLGVDFAPYNLGFLTQNLADITFTTIYEPARERYDFPLRTGDQWTSSYESGTNVSGSSDYFDPTEFDTPYIEDNTTYQVTTDGEPSEDGDSIDYTGCADSYKVNNWNNTGAAGGFEWYCPAVRTFAWYRITNPAGFQIDWKLKTYTPTDSSGNVPDSSPGIRNLVIDVTPEFIAILPNATEEVVGHMTVNGANEVGTNLQLRYEIDGTIMSMTTDSNGEVSADLDVGDSVDASPSSDDWTSNGIIIWDPVNKIVGAATIVVDLSVVGVDLVAKPDSMIVTRFRGNDSLVLSQASGYNALPGDTMHFSVPAQNRGVLTSPSTEMEITTPDGATIRGTLPALAPYTEARVEVNWTVPIDAAIGNQTLTFMVDPDQTVTADANRSNNGASLDIYIGRMPVANMTLYDGVYTFENVTIDASASYDIDSGPVVCYFEIQDGVRTQYIDSPSCMTNWSWADDGNWEVKVVVVDDELDEVEMVMNATILNRAPYVNLSTLTPSVNAGEPITFNASDSGDIDTISPEGQHVTISWPGSGCIEGLYGPYCTITNEAEGEHVMQVLVTDDDGATAYSNLSYEILNIVPTIGEMRFSIGGVAYDPDENGIWDIDEGVEATLSIDANDSLSDRENLLITWNPSDRDQNWTQTTVGPVSVISTSWDTSGLHTISAFVTDDDGETSETILGYVRVNNIAPVLGALPAQDTLFEDQKINLVASAFDEADADELIFCWDLDSTEDMDENGIADDDCDIAEAELNYSWSREVYRVITANVWDDDGARHSSSIQITILNFRPTAIISVGEEYEIDDDGTVIITEGDSITFSGAESNDTATDRASLYYLWDSPVTTGASEDGSGDTFTIKFTKPGTFLVNLTVTDDDGRQHSATKVVKVEAAPSEGLLGMNSTTTFTVILAIVIAALVGVLLIRGLGRKDDPMEKTVADLAWDSPAQSSLLDMTSGFDAPGAEPQAQENLEQAPQTADVGPPLPATGLPEGWTMEQWSYYGEQYLASQAATPVAQPAYQEPTPVQQPTYQEPAPQQVYQPTVQEPAPTPASQALSDLLDDLDL